MGICLSEDWPTYQHDNQRTGVTVEEVKPPLFLQWEFTPAFPPAKGWPLPVNGYNARKNKNDVSHDDCFHVISVGNNAYFANSGENRIYAVDTATGKIKWTYFTDGCPKIMPTYWKGKIIFGAEDGKVTCVDAETGKQVWQFNSALNDEKMLSFDRFSSLWPVKCGIMVDNDVLYFASGLFPEEGVYLYAVNPADGKLIWRRQLDKGGIQSPSPQGIMLASDDSVFTTSRVTPDRWNKKDGAGINFETPFPEVPRAHEFRFYAGGTNTQLLNGKTLVFGNAAILAYDYDKNFKDKYGKEKKGEYKFGWFNARQMIFKGDMAYVATDYNVIGIEQKNIPDITKTEVEEFRETYNKMGIPGQMDNHENYDFFCQKFGKDSPFAKYFENGPFRWGKANWDKWPDVAKGIFDKMAKKCKWMTPLVATEFMVMAGNVLYLGAEDKVIAMDPATGKELWSFKTDSRVRGISIANKRVFVSTIDGKIRCFSVADNRNPAKIAVQKNPQPFAKNANMENLAKNIISGSGIKSGYCLLVGGNGNLAAELAKISDLNIYIINPDEKVVSEIRSKLAESGLYGGRIIAEAHSLNALPYPPYVFNIVVDETSIGGKASQVPANEILRVTRPFGGSAFFGLKPANLDIAKFAEITEEKAVVKTLYKITRGRIKGSKDWTHNYGTPALTYCNEDATVKGPFGIIWYGEPGERKRIERHSNPPMPLVVNGIFFTISYNTVMAYDAFNGIQLWEKYLMGVSRSMLPLDTSNMATDEKSVFVVVEKGECLRLDAKTGNELKKYFVPAKAGSEMKSWSWIVRDGSLVLGSRSEIDVPRRKPNGRTSDAIFAFDADSGQQKWIYEGKGIDHNGIAVGDGKIFFLDDNLTDEEKKTALAFPPKDSSFPDREIKDAAKAEKDLRKIVVLDENTGKKIWEKPFNADDMTVDNRIVGNNNVTVFCMYKDKTLVVAGTGAFGHPYNEYYKGEYSRQAIYAFSSDDGKLLWGGRRNYFRRPIIAGDTIYAEPFAWKLRTGESVMVENPLSGQMQKLDFFRGYVGCSHLLSSGPALFGARGGISFWNLDDRSGFVPFTNVDVSCGIGLTPADGILIAPEGRSGCTCPTPVFTSIVLYPREKQKNWGAGFNGVTGGEAKSLPVKHAYINLGAPGYRQDASGKLWIPYLAPSNAVGTGLIGKWLPEYSNNPDQFYCFNEDDMKITGTDRPWLYICGYNGVTPLNFRMQEKGASQKKYTIRLHFAEPEENVKAGERIFSLSILNNELLKDFDIVKEAGVPRKALVKEFKGVQAGDNLSILMKPADSSKIKLPVLCAIEALAE